VKELVTLVNRSICNLSVLIRNGQFRNCGASRRARTVILEARNDAEILDWYLARANAFTIG
jgi:hypothetical protein